MRLLTVFLCLIIHLTLCSTYLHASSLITLSAGADPWPPYIDPDLPKGGVSVQIADAALRTQGYTVRNKVLPWARALEETKRGRIDLILDAWWSQERSTFFHFSRPYINGPLKFIKRKGDTFNFKDLTSLHGKSIVLVRNYAYGDEFLASNNYEKYTSHDFLQSMQMLVLGRVDLTLENELVARTRLQNNAPALLNQIEWVENPLSDNYVYVICSYDHPQHHEIIGAFNKGLSTILKNGTYQKILADNKLPVPGLFPELKRK